MAIDRKLVSGSFLRRRHRSDNEADKRGGGEMKGLKKKKSEEKDADKRNQVAAADASKDNDHVLSNHDKLWSPV